MQQRLDLTRLHETPTTSRKESPTKPSTPRKPTQATKPQRLLLEHRVARAPDDSLAASNRWIVSPPRPLALPPSPNHRRPRPLATKLPTITTVSTASKQLVNDLPGIDKALRHAAMECFLSTRHNQTIHTTLMDPQVYFCLQKRSAFGIYSLREVVAVLQLFHSLDRDHSNSICLGELQALQPRFAKHGHSNLDAVFHSVDRNADGQIQLRELLECCFPHATSHQMKEMLLLASIGDLTTFLTNRPNHQTPLQAKHEPTDPSRALVSTEEEEIRAIFSLFDRNHDGVLSVDEVMLACGVDNSEAQADQSQDEPMPRFLTRADVLQVYHDFDKNHDQVLDFHEFLALMH